MYGDGERLAFPMKDKNMKLKGCQKKVLKIKGKVGDLFEEAYFILRPQEEETLPDNIVKEAEKLLASSAIGREKRSFLFKKEDVFLFLSGVFLTLVIVAITALIF